MFLLVPEYVFFEELVFAGANGPSTAEVVEVDLTEGVTFLKG